MSKRAREEDDSFDFIEDSTDTKKNKQSPKSIRFIITNIITNTRKGLEDVFKFDGRSSIFPECASLSGDQLHILTDKAQKTIKCFRDVVDKESFECFSEAYLEYIDCAISSLQKLEDDKVFNIPAPVGLYACAVIRLHDAWCNDQLDYPVYQRIRNMSFAGATNFFAIVKPFVQYLYYDWKYNTFMDSEGMAENDMVDQRFSNKYETFVSTYSWFVPKIVHRFSVGPVVDIDRLKLGEQLRKILIGYNEDHVAKSDEMLSNK